MRWLDALVASAAAAVAACLPVPYCFVAVLPAGIAVFFGGAALLAHLRRLR